MNIDPHDFTDEELFDYVEGILDADRVREIAQRMTNDAELAAQIQCIEDLMAVQLPNESHVEARPPTAAPTGEEPADLLREFDRLDRRYKPALSLFERVYNAVVVTWTMLPLSRVGGRMRKMTKVLQLREHLRLCVTQGRLEEARHAAQRAGDIVRSLFGEEHREYARCLDNLGEVILATGNANALDQFELARAIRERLLGTAHVEYAASLQKIATVAFMANRLDVAEGLLRNALTIWQRSFGEWHPAMPNLLNDLGVVLGELGRFDEGTHYVERAIELCRRNLGEEHPKTCGLMFNLAQMKRKCGQEYVAILQRARSGLTDYLGINHPAVAADRRLPIMVSMPSQNGADWLTLLPAA